MDFRLWGINNGIWYSFEDPTYLHLLSDNRFTGIFPQLGNLAAFFSFENIYGGKYIYKIFEISKKNCQVQTSWNVVKNVSKKIPILRRQDVTQGGKRTLRAFQQKFVDIYTYKILTWIISIKKFYLVLNGVN